MLASHKKTWTRRFVVVVVVMCIMFGTLLLQNENRPNSPQPKAVVLRSNTDMRNVTDKSFSNGSFNKRHASMTTSRPPFNYMRTKQWGKQDKAAWNLYYGDLDCRENYRRKTMIAILRTWLKLAKENHIEYVFHFGSLLGIVRNNDVNPWDHDMDIMVSNRDILKLEKVGWPRTNPKARDGLSFINYIPNSQHNVSIDERKRWDCDGKPAKRHVDQCSIQEPLVRIYNSGVFLDVFSYWTTNDNVELITEGHHFKIKKTDYFPLRHCIFMGFDTWCPNNPQSILTALYGKFYMTPKKRCKKGHWI